MKKKLHHARHTYCEPPIVPNSLEMVIMQMTISQIHFIIGIFNSMTESGTFLS